MEKWTSRKITKFSQQWEMQSPAAGQVISTWYGSGLGTGRLESSFAEKGPQGPRGQQVDHELAMYPCCRGSQQHIELH